MKTLIAKKINPCRLQQFTWHAGDLRKGMYLCRVQAGKEVALRKIMKL